MLSAKEKRKLAREAKKNPQTSSEQVPLKEETNEEYANRVTEEALAKKKVDDEVVKVLQKKKRDDMAVVDASASLDPDQLIDMSGFMNEGEADVPGDPHSYRKTPSVEEALRLQVRGVTHSICGDWSHANDQPSGLHFLRFTKSTEGAVTDADYENINNYYCMPSVNPGGEMLTECPAREVKLGGREGNERVRLTAVKLCNPYLDRQRCENNQAFEVELTFSPLRQGGAVPWIVQKSVFPANMNANEVMREMLSLPSYVAPANKNYRLAEMGAGNHGGVPGTYYPRINRR